MAAANQLLNIIAMYFFCVCVLIFKATELLWWRWFLIQPLLYSLEKKREVVKIMSQNLQNETRREKWDWLMQSESLWLNQELWWNSNDQLKDRVYEKLTSPEEFISLHVEFFFTDLWARNNSSHHRGTLFHHIQFVSCSAKWIFLDLDQSSWKIKADKIGQTSLS